MSASLRLVLVLIVLTGCAFFIGYVAGWSNGRASYPAGGSASVHGTPSSDPHSIVRPETALDRPEASTRPAPQPGDRPLSLPQRATSAVSPRSNPPASDVAANKTGRGQLLPAPQALRKGTAGTPPSTPAAEPSPAESSSVASDGPSIYVADATHDFGSVTEGDTVREAFVLENRGAAPLHVRKVSTGCGCMAALASSEVLAPGETGKVEVTFNTLGYKGELAKQVYVESDDLRNPRLVLKITGKIIRDIDATPSFIDFGTITTGATVTKKVRIASGQGASFAITKLAASSPFIHPAEPRKLADGGYEFEVTSGPVSEPRRISSNIFISLDSPRQPRLVMVAFGNVVASQEGAGK